jgi:hypothetical protein
MEDQPIEQLEQGKETEVTVQLRAPECPGRCVSYFRMKAPSSSLKDKENNKHENKSDFQWFGQRLWVDILVTDDEVEWQVVRLSTDEESDTFSETVEVTEELIHTLEYENNYKEVEFVVDSEKFHCLQKVEDDFKEAKAEIKENNNVYQLPHDFLIAEEAKEGKWRLELENLRDMGFDNDEVIIPLLESQIRDENLAETSEERLQVVVDILLSQVGYK